MICTRCGSEFVEIVEGTTHAGEASARDTISSAYTAPEPVQSAEAQQASEQNAPPASEGSQIPGLQGMITSLLTSILPAALIGNHAEANQHSTTSDQAPQQGFSLSHFFGGQTPPQAGQNAQQTGQESMESQAQRSAEQYNAQANPMPFNDFFTGLFSGMNQPAAPAGHAGPHFQSDGSSISFSWSTQWGTQWGSQTLDPTQQAGNADNRQQADGNAPHVHTSTQTFTFGPGMNGEQGFVGQPPTNIPDLATFLSQALNAAFTNGNMQPGDFVAPEFFDQVVSELMNTNPQANLNPASEDVMKALKRQKWQGTEPAEACSICQDEYQPQETLVVLNCKHAYHEECCLTWLKNNGVCPICRSPVTMPEDKANAPSRPAQSTAGSASDATRSAPDLGQQSQSQAPPQGQASRSQPPQFNFMPFHFQVANGRSASQHGQTARPNDDAELPEDELD